MGRQFATIDEYISTFPDDVQVILAAIRRSVRTVVPAAGERISYEIPTMTLDGKALVHFAAWKHHVALYPLPAVDEALEQELAPFREGKSTARFPLREPIPYDLIERLVALLADQRGGHRG